MNLSWDARDLCIVGVAVDETIWDYYFDTAVTDATLWVTLLGAKIYILFYEEFWAYPEFLVSRDLFEVSCAALYTHKS